MYGSIMTIFSLLSCITSLLGCWQLGETSTCHIDENGKETLIYRNVANVAPSVYFLGNNEGIIKYADGQVEPFDWQMQSENSINVTIHKDSIENHIFNIYVSDKKAILREYKKHDMIYKHILYRTNYTVEDLFHDTEADITDSEQEYLRESNPFSNFRCYVVEGLIKERTRLLIGGQDGMKLQSGPPNSQSVLFVKSSNCQQNIPCFLLTYNCHGKILYAQFVKHVRLPQKQ